MMRHKALVFALAVVMLSSFCGMGFAAPTATTRQFNVSVFDADKQPLPCADVYVYAGTERQLVFHGQTNADGQVAVSLDTTSLPTDPQGQFVDFTAHSHHKDAGVSVATWSEAVIPGSRNAAISVTLFHRGERDRSVAYTPSGIFREVMISYSTYYDPIVIAEMHAISGMEVEAEYSSSVKSSIQAGYKQTFPVVGTWSVSGTVTKYLSNTDTWNSSGMVGQARGLTTYFQCRSENWEYQEEDGDIPDVWHTVEAWTDLFVVSHSGSALWGDAVSTTNDGKPYADVIGGDYGSFRAIAPGGTSKVASTGSKTYAGAWNRSGFSASSTNTYSSGLTWEFKNTRPAGGLNVAAYDMGTGCIWYVTSQ